MNANTEADIDTDTDIDTTAGTDKIVEIVVHTRMSKDNLNDLTFTKRNMPSILHLYVHAIFTYIEYSTLRYAMLPRYPTLHYTTQYIHARTNYMHSIRCTHTCIHGLHACMHAHMHAYIRILDDIAPHNIMLHYLT